MRTGWTMLALLGLIFGAGCATGGFDPSTVARGSGEKTPIVVNRDTEETLTDRGVVDARILAEALSAVQDQGSVIYVDHDGVVRSPDGTVFVDKDGRTLRVRTVTIAKLNSLQALQGIEGVGKLTYVVGGRGYLPDLPETQQFDTGGPEALRLEIENVDRAAAASPLPDIVAARTEERRAILEGLPAVVKEQWIGKNARLQLLGDGLARVITNAGKAVEGVLLGASPIGAGVEALRVTLKDADTGEVRTEVLEEKEGGG